MFTLETLTDHFSGKPAVRLRIELNATDVDIDAAREALPASIRDRMRTTPKVLFILAALKNVNVEDPCYSSTFVLPGAARARR